MDLTDVSRETKFALDRVGAMAKGWFHVKHRQPAGDGRMVVIRMAEILVEGTNLGYTEKAYDFVDDQGERRQGVSQRLHVLVGTEVLDLRVPDERITGARALEANAVVALRVAIPKNARLTLVEAV